MIERSLDTPDVGHTGVYGVSDNNTVWWDNRLASKLDYKPKDSSEVFREKVDAQPLPAADDPAMLYQGGAFVASGPFGDQ
ncbi:hypothetical protein AO073_03315 [Pseudomonas syringae ICMP 11293]|nr:hypothetical protein [Pseudomonas syringae]KTB93390.1 hypothetical protein AO073_03315 [Pseudomonas syringae ICMP 11293]